MPGKVERSFHTHTQPTKVRNTHMHCTCANTHICTHLEKHTRTTPFFPSHSQSPHMCMCKNTSIQSLALSPLFAFPLLMLPPCLSFWLWLFQQSQLITAHCCRQLETTTNLEFHYSKLFHMCIQGPGRLGWPRFRKEQPPLGTNPHSANTAALPSLLLFSFFLLISLFLIHFPLHRLHRSPIDPPELKTPCLTMVLWPTMHSVPPISNCFPPICCRLYNYC